MLTKTVFGVFSPQKRIPGSEWMGRFRDEVRISCLEGTIGG